MENTLLLANETVSYDTLEDAVRQAQQGDATTLPVIRELLDQTPELWENARNLATQVERTWIQALSGRDLVSQELLERDVQALRTTLQGSAPSPLENLLIERICACWLAVQHAELRAASRLQRSMTLSTAEEKRLDSTQRRFLGAVKSLAQVRRILTPKVQLNVAQQQINLA
jgi:sigma54-dependent transcription regulator